MGYAPILRLAKPLATTKNEKNNLANIGNFYDCPRIEGSVNAERIEIWEYITTIQLRK